MIILSCKVIVVQIYWASLYFTQKLIVLISNGHSSSKLWGVSRMKFFVQWDENEFFLGLTNWIFVVYFIGCIIHFDLSTNKFQVAINYLIIKQFIYRDFSILSIRFMGFKRILIKNVKNSGFNEITPRFRKVCIFNSFENKDAHVSFSL